MTPLCVAVEKGNVDIVKILLENSKTNVNIPSLVFLNQFFLNSVFNQFLFIKFQIPELFMKFFLQIFFNYVLKKLFFNTIQIIWFIQFSK